MWFPPPLIYFAFFLFGLLLQKIFPLPAIPEIIGRVAGGVFVVFGAGVLLWCHNLFRRAHTSPIPIKPTTALVMDGPYRFSRNPMYLGLLIVYVGLALFINVLLWSVILLPAIILMVYYFAIRKEEQYLERKFGGEYVKYKTRVRRWL